jgi:Flp pilus assembly protein TadG
MASRRGTATVEFALIAPLLLLFLAGVLDYTMVIRMAIAATDAARAGAAFGSLSTANAGNLTGMQTAAINAAPDVTGLTATAAKTCQCSNGTTVSCSGGTCATGPVRTYVTVTVQATDSSIFSYTQLPFTGAVNAQASMRAQ